MNKKKVLLKVKEPSTTKSKTSKKYNNKLNILSKCVLSFDYWVLCLTAIDNYRLNRNSKFQDVWVQDLSALVLKNQNLDIMID